MTGEDQVRAAVLDYIEGWFDGDAERMERALHPELVKRCRGIEGDDPDALETLTQQEMVDATAQGEGREEDADDRQISVEITYSGENIASATCLGRFCGNPRSGRGFAVLRAGRDGSAYRDPDDRFSRSAAVPDGPTARLQRSCR